MDCLSPCALASSARASQEGYRLPGPASNPGLFAVAKTPIEAITTAPTLGLAQIIGVIFLIELATSGKLLDTESFFEEGEEPTEKAPAGSGRPGDLGWDPLGLSADGLNGDYAIAELKHGRLGMLGAAGTSRTAQAASRAICARRGARRPARATRSHAIHTPRSAPCRHACRLAHLGQVGFGADLRVAQPPVQRLNRSLGETLGGASDI
jgi:hypothetical protein